jgi:hypothetical protein
MGRYLGGIPAGSTSWSVDVVLRSVTDGTEVTGKVAADCTATYWREGETPASITLTDLTTLTDAWTEGGFKASTQAGSYRLDLPDAALATGADWVEVNIAAAGTFIHKERFPLDATTPALAAGMATLLTQVASLVSANANPAGVKKNTALSNFPFEMVHATTGLPLAGLTVTAQRRLDGGSFTATTNAPAEIGGGAYTINLSAADLNADTVMLRFTAPGARPRTFTIITEP